MGFAKPQPADTRASAQPLCNVGDVQVSDAFKKQRLFDGLVDSFSMRGFVPSEAVTGHDHFFGVFAKFSGTASFSTRCLPAPRRRTSNISS